MKIHLGCGNNLLEGYLNIDKFVIAENVLNLDVLNLPFSDGEVELILAEHLVEHLSFNEEKRFFNEMFRILKPDGILKIEVPDFEWVVNMFIKSKDEFKSFYQVGAVDHYFGNGPKCDNRWGILTTAIWGNQNGDGQFHKNGYTKTKIESVGKLVGFNKVEIETGFNKGTQVLIARLTK